MSITVREIRDWLEGMPDTVRIGIADDAMTLAVVDAEDALYLEVGALPGGCECHPGATHRPTDCPLLEEEKETP